MYLSTLQKTVHIIGDFNINVDHKSHNITKKFLKKIEQLNLSQLVNEPTRISETSSTTIDLFITNNVSKVKEVKCIDEVLIADHRSLLVNLDIKPPALKSRQIVSFRKLNKYSPDALQYTLVNKSIDRSCNSDDINSCAKNFTEIFNESLNIVAPTASKFSKPGIRVKLSEKAD